MPASEAVILSACLTGINCRYDGGNRLEKALLSELKDCVIVPVCPEQLGGLPTPREPAEITEGDGFDVLEGHSGVVTQTGWNVTKFFLNGAEEALKTANIAGTKRAYLKEKSPSCGVEMIKKKGRIVAGSGVFAALLRNENFIVSGV